MFYSFSFLNGPHLRDEQCVNSTLAYLSTRLYNVLPYARSPELNYLRVRASTATSLVKVRSI